MYASNPSSNRRAHQQFYEIEERSSYSTNIWERLFGKEFGSLAQGDDLTGKNGTNTVQFMTYADIAQLVLRHNKVVTYARIVADYRE